MCLLALSGCCFKDLRQIDSRHPQQLRASLKLHFEPGVTDPAEIERIAAGDIIAFRGDEASSDGSLMWASALGGYSHVALVFPILEDKLRVITADSNRGVEIDSIERCIGGKEFYVFAFPEGNLDFGRLALFAQRARLLGRLDYDWSAALFGWNSNVTPNTLPEVEDEYTCATVVAAALHFSGLSLERAYCPCQIISPADIVFSSARRNLNRSPATENASGGER